jgi:catechol 2,3-dioxygenase-like lactoylglutathione lyase family enzyme
MIDHMGINVTNLERSKTFYQKALAPLGYQVISEYPASVTGSVSVVGMGVPPKADFWLAEGSLGKPPSHVAFRAENRKVVDEFYKEAISAGGRDNGKPGLRPHYHSNYYGAFVLDLDGNNIEAVCHKP